MKLLVGSKTYSCCYSWNGKKSVSIVFITGRKELTLWFLLNLLPKWRQNSGWATKSLKAFRNFQRLFWHGWFSAGRLILFLLVNLFCQLHLSSFYWPKWLRISPFVLFFYEVFVGWSCLPTQPVRDCGRPGHFYFLNVWWHNTILICSNKK